MKDYIIRATDKDLNIRVFIATSTNMVEESRKTHNTAATATAALGRTLTAAAIMGAMLKGEKDKITVSIKGNGPIGNILAVANNLGDVKGYVDNPNVDLEPRADKKLNVGGAVGLGGRLVVIRDFGLKEPYIGQSNLISGEIAEDLAHYFNSSEQQPSVVALGVLVNTDLTVKAAGGFILQILPNTPDDVIDKLEEAISNMKPISYLIDQGKTPEDILEDHFGMFDMEIKEKKEIRFVCDCSRDRLEEVLISLGQKEIEKMINEDGKAEVVCHFCNTKYNFDKGDLESILDASK